MRMSWKNPFAGVLRNEANDSDAGGVGSKGLIAGLENFIDENPGATLTKNSTEAAQSSGRQRSDDAPPAGGDGDEDPPSNEPLKDSRGLPRSFEDDFSDDAPAGKPAGEKGEDEEEEEDDFGLPGLGEKADPPEGKKEDPKPFDEAAFDKQTEQEVAGLDPKQGEAWRTLKNEVKALRKAEADRAGFNERLKQLEEENQALKETAGEVEAMRERVKSVTSRNAELLLEDSAEYQSKVVVPHKDITETIDALAEARGVPKEEIWAAIRENEPVKRMAMIDALEEKIGGRHALAVQQMATDMRIIARHDQEMRANAEQIVEQAKRADLQTREKSSEADIEAFRASARESFTRYADRIPGFTDETKNLTDAAEAARAKALTVDVTKLASGDLGYMVFSVQALPAALRELKRLRTENRDLRVAAGKKETIGPGQRKKREGDGPAHIDEQTGQPRTFMSGFMQQDFSGD